MIQGPQSHLEKVHKARFSEGIPSGPLFKSGLLD